MDVGFAKLAVGGVDQDFDGAWPTVREGQLFDLGVWQRVREAGSDRRGSLPS